MGIKTSISGKTFPTAINQVQNEENTGCQKWQSKTLKETLKYRKGMKQSEKNFNNMEQNNKFRNETKKT